MGHGASLRPTGAVGVSAAGATQKAIRIGGSSFPQKVWSKADEGGVQQTFQVDGRIVEVKYTVELNLDRKTIQSENLSIENKDVTTQEISTDAAIRSLPLTLDGRSDQPGMRLVMIDLTVVPEQIDFVKMQLPASLPEIKTADQLRQRTPAILDLLKEDSRVAKFLNVEVSSAEERFYALGKLSREAFDRGDSADATKLAEEYLALAARFPTDWNYGNAIHDANELLGLVAIESGDVAKAKAYLLAAGKSTGSPQLDSFGPNLELAAGLLARGEKQAVLDYLNSVGKFWTMGKERLARFKKTIEEGHVPPELQPAASAAPLVGRWLAEESRDDKTAPKMLLTFAADGTATQSLLSRGTTMYRFVDDRLVLSPGTGKEETPQRLEFKDGKLVLGTDGKGRYGVQELALTRVDGDDKPGSIVGTWTTKKHIEDLGDAELRFRFDSKEAGAMTFEIEMPAALRFSYTLKGEKLKYTVDGRPHEARCQVAGDRLTLTGLLTLLDDKPHVFRRLPPQATQTAVQP